MTESRTMNSRMMFVAAAAAVALTACGGSGGATTSSSTVAQTNQVTAPATTTGASTTAPTTATTTGAAIAVTRACVASMLSLSYLGGQGATGHGELGFALRNTSPASCHTFGYPGVLFLGKSGQGLTTTTMRTTHDFFGIAPESRVTLAPGHSASFRLGVTHGAASPANCTTAYAVQVIPPDDTATLKATIPNGGAYECGTVTVSPVRPGTSAYP
jgi:hypothetical protein